jgi:HEPN/RES N-terminal domain 1/RES domain
MDGGYYEDFWSTEPASDLSVCSDCFDDEDITQLIESAVESKKCDFCGRKSRTRPIAAPLVEVVRFMSVSIHREYERAVEALGWDGAEGGYQGEHFDSYDLLADYIGLALPNDDGRLIQVLADCFGDEPWCKRDPYGMRRDERLKFSWERFCEFIKHKRRYFFLQNWSDPFKEYLAPSQLLGFVARAAEKYVLVKKLPADSLIYRARQQKADEILSTPYDFGPPPLERAIRSNRMSPAGIVMFYGSDDAETAIAEIDDNPSLGIWVGTFRTARPALILDLTALPRRYRFFEIEPDSSDADRYAIEFLHSFVESMAEKVERGDREHVDYVPTQLVTEYFRTTFRHAGSIIDGIRYFSAQRPKGKSLVLFADQANIVLHQADVEQIARSGECEAWQLNMWKEKAWLELIDKQRVRPPVARKD